MTVNVGKLELELTKKIAATTDSQDLLALSTAIKKLKNNAVDYIDTYANLPAATTTNAGRMYYVASEQAIYWSTGSANVAMTNAVGVRTLWAWGYGNSGRLGTGNTTNTSSPVTTIAGGTTWNKISTGCTHSLSIKTDGTLWVWGFNTPGQLGTGNTTAYSSPVTTAGGGTNWCSLGKGGYTSSAIKTDGTLWLWGKNDCGQIGNNSITNYSSPVTTAGGGTNWCTVATGGYAHTLAIKTDGTLWTWGRNDWGQLATNNTTCYSSPVTTAGGGTTWCAVSNSSCSSASIKSDGTLWAWGSNSYGNLGTGDTTNRSSPVTTAGGGTTWCQVSSGIASTHAIKTDGTLWGMGNNAIGTLGTNNTTNTSSPVTTAGGGTNWCKVGAGGSTVIAIKTDGTMWGMGQNQFGELGHGDTSCYCSPVSLLGGITSWCDVSTGSDHSIAIAYAAY